MTGYSDLINRQYGYDHLTTRILTMLQQAGKDINALTHTDLASFDQFHVGGIVETRHLAELAGLKKGMLVLDVGSGLGGPARTLAAEFGCHITGIDLTRDFCEAAEALTQRLGLADRVRFKQGNALDMPFEDQSFNVVWTQFAAMNIADKARLYAEFRRVLRPGGVVALHEVMAGTDGEPYYPVLWANDASISHLRQPEEIRRLLRDAGFRERVWNDVTDQSFDWFRAMRSARESPPPLGFNVFVGDRVQEKAANILRSLEENCIAVVQAVFELPSPA